MVTSIEMTQRFLYGANNTPIDKSNPDIIRPEGHITNFSMTQTAYMAEAGKFAKGAQFEIIQEFFLMLVTFYQPEPTL